MSFHSTSHCPDCAVGRNVHGSVGEIVHGSVGEIVHGSVGEIVHGSVGENAHCSVGEIVPGSVWIGMKKLTTLPSMRLVYEPQK